MLLPLVDPCIAEIAELAETFSVFLEGDSAGVGLCSRGDESKEGFGDGVVR